MVNTKYGRLVCLFWVTFFCAVCQGSAQYTTTGYANHTPEPTRCDSSDSSRFCDPGCILTEPQRLIIDGEIPKIEDIMRNTMDGMDFQEEYQIGVVVAHHTPNTIGTPGFFANEDGDACVLGDDPHRTRIVVLLSQDDDSRWVCKVRVVFPDNLTPFASTTTNPMSIDGDRFTDLSTCISGILPILDMEKMYNHVGVSRYTQDDILPFIFALVQFIMLSYLSVKMKTSCVSPCVRRFVSKTTKGETCSICLEDFHELKQKITELDCGHQFHESCIKSWEDAGKNTCPLCRATNLYPR